VTDQRNQGRPKKPAPYRAERATMAPYDLGRQGAANQAAAVERYNARPPDPCPFHKGTPEEAEYDRGWKDWFRDYRQNADSP
jgi:hypothetical protein